MNDIINTLLEMLFYVSFILLSPFLLFRIFLTEEDSYHLLRNKEDGGRIIVKFIKNQYSSIEEIKNKTQTLIECYNKNNIHKIQPHDSKCVFTDSNEYNNFGEDVNYHYKMFVNSNDNVIYGDFKHKYIGGAYLRDFMLSSVSTQQVSNEKYYPHSSPINIFPFVKLLYNYKSLPKITGDLLRLAPSKTGIQRYVNTYTIDRQDKSKYSSRIIIIFNALKTIQQTLHIGRPLVCYLPVAFNHVYGVSNNIGILFIEIFEQDTIDTFTKRFEQNKYHALATNFILLNNLHKISIHNGSNIRKSVDIVLTSLYYNCDEPEDESMLQWTYENVAEYPIYIAISSCVMKEKIVVSQTITSNMGKINLPVAEYKEIGYDYFIPI